MPKTITTVQTSLAAWRAAELALANGQTFTMNGRSLTRTNLKEVRAMIASLERQEAQLLSYASSSKAPSPFSAGVAKIN